MKKKKDKPALEGKEYAFEDNETRQRLTRKLVARGHGFVGSPDSPMIRVSGADAIAYVEEFIATS
jgi:hypothetical protein